MKQRTLLLSILFLLLLPICHDGNAVALDSRMDSIEVSLLTCEPHDEVYSHYGHTALRYHDLRRGYEERDLVFNYGVFNYQKPFFVLRFIFGLTDYELGLTSFGSFCKEYRRHGCEVTEQVLDLTGEEKQRLTEALSLNLREENRIYRYNFFFDNCATRPRDIVERSIKGRVEYPGDSIPGETFRQIIHRYTANHPWTAFGNDVLLGLRADQPTSRTEREFLPDNLRSDIAQAMVRRIDGSVRPLIKEERTALPPGVQKIHRGFPLTPLACGILLLAVAVAVAWWEWRNKKCLVWWDITLMLLTGLTGCIVFIMLFSQHPATTLNLTVLLLNPLPLLFIRQVARRRKTRFFTLQAALVLLFLIGGLWQHYAEGLYFVALCLLLRYWTHHNDK